MSDPVYLRDLYKCECEEGLLSSTQHFRVCKKYEKLLWQSAGLNPKPAEYNLIFLEYSAENFILLLLFEEIFNLIG